LSQFQFMLLINYYFYISIKKIFNLLKKNYCLKIIKLTYKSIHQVFVKESVGFI